MGRKLLVNKKFKKNYTGCDKMSENTTKHEGLY